jgi:hypothetical protein
LREKSDKTSANKDDAERVKDPLKGENKSERERERERRRTLEECDVCGN